jgi:hypothetical protein
VPNVNVGDPDARMYGRPDEFVTRWPRAAASLKRFLRALGLPSLTVSAKNGFTYLVQKQTKEWRSSEDGASGHKDSRFMNEMGRAVRTYACGLQSGMGGDNNVRDSQRRENAEGISHVRHMLIKAK